MRSSPIKEISALDALQNLKEVAQRVMDSDNRREVRPGITATVEMLSMGQGRIVLADARDRVRPVGPDGCPDGWDYETVSGATSALTTWNVETEAEPAGWVRHIPSNRRRRYDAEGVLELEWVAESTTP